MKRLLTRLVLATSFLTLSFASVASAHVTVKPAEVLTGSRQIFTVNAPNEKDIEYTSIKLLIPEGVSSFSPYAKAGWDIAVESNSITWTGSVASGLVDSFNFSAKIGDKAGELTWKAYQTYADGTVVAWDQKEEGEAHGDGNRGPFSVTKVASESAEETAAADLEEKADSAKKTSQLALGIAIAGLAITLVQLAALSKKK